MYQAFCANFILQVTNAPRLGNEAALLLHDIMPTVIYIHVVLWIMCNLYCRIYKYNCMYSAPKEKSKTFEIFQII